ncbi:hypothetical protein FVE85_2720 [Porphyridium purpureum]|uniref:Uncharacterized protein n=1 Tax=Porphyridium purpureum TaxID=35688 RepID=A0A5J4YSS4_PORPP|nr:hypothetical protein FVE85_2720 [Porphyridium purpureum]|eukprot:POR6032..scf227_4
MGSVEGARGVIHSLLYSVVERLDDCAARLDRMRATVGRHLEMLGDSDETDHVRADEEALAQREAHSQVPAEEESERTRSNSPMRRRKLRKVGEAGRIRVDDGERMNRVRVEESERAKRAEKRTRVKDGNSTKRVRDDGKDQSVRRARDEGDARRLDALRSAIEAITSGDAKHLKMYIPCRTLDVVCKAEQQIWWPANVVVDERQIPASVKRLREQIRARVGEEVALAAVRYYPVTRREWGIVRVVPEKFIPIEVFKQNAFAVQRYHIWDSIPAAMSEAFSEAFLSTCEERDDGYALARDVISSARLPGASEVRRNISDHAHSHVDLEHRVHDLNAYHSQFSSSSSEH